MTKMLILSGEPAVIGSVATPPTAAHTYYNSYHLDADGRRLPNHSAPPRHHCPPNYFAHVASTNGYHDSEGLGASAIRERDSV
jgi:hypothetical protein